jgi:Berberine and berberine like
MRPFSNGGVYMNFAGLADDTEQLREAMLGSSQERLEHIRAEYDPDGVFETAARRP